MKFLVLVGILFLSSSYTHAYISPEKVEQAFKESEVTASERLDGLTNYTIKSSHKEEVSVEEANLDTLKQKAIEAVNGNVLTIVEFLCFDGPTASVDEVEPICNVDYSGEENFAECELELTVACK